MDYGFIFMLVVMGLAFFAGFMERPDNWGYPVRGRPVLLVAAVWIVIYGTLPMLFWLGVL